MDEKLPETTNLGVEIMNSNRQDSKEETLINQSYFYALLVSQKQKFSWNMPRPMEIKTLFEVHAPVVGTPRRNTVFQHSF